MKKDNLQAERKEEMQRRKQSNKIYIGEELSARKKLKRLVRIYKGEE